MRKILLSFVFCAAAAVPALADQGCIEVSTTTVTATVCEQFDCVQRSGGECVTWNCNRSHTTKYVDELTSGCTRVANCGKKAVFQAGDPVEGDSDSTEQCDWYPCVQINPETHACIYSMCVSKRVFETVRATYPDAQCVPVRALSLPQEQPVKPAASKWDGVAPSPENLSSYVPHLN